MDSTLLRLVLIATTLFACTGSPVVGGGRDTGNDLSFDLGNDQPASPPDVAPDASSAPDVTDAFDLDADLPGTDAPDVTDGANLDADAADAGTPRCVSNADCASSSAGPVCDTETGRCVACTAMSDLCPVGRYCDEASRTCVMGCRNDDACAMGASGADAGTTSRTRCDRMSRACVECVLGEHCPPGNLCVGNACVPGCTMERPCPTGQSCCGGACVDPLANIAHCGACNARCATPNATATCLNGNCSVGMCAAPFGDCDAVATNGCETNTLTTVAHCGTCGNACPMRANATATCTAGACGFTCNADFADCDMNPANGCETNLTDDPARCGSCATVCNPPNATPACTMGRCSVGRCATGFGDCDGNPTNGCEVDTAATTAHCGRCGNACTERANAFPGCLGGRCVTSCVMGFQDCDGAEANGCEADIRSDARNCGACGRVCDPSQATGTCSMGRCTITTCNAGFADCDMDPSNGCEVNIRADARNCGRCGNVCVTMGGTPACTDATCGLAMCAAGRGNCDGNAGNGCEVDLGTDARNCGACGTVCDLPNASPRCAEGRCTIATCNAGFANCNGNPADGCEVNLNTTVTACGSCGRVCALANATATCTGGRCAIAACNTGFADCNGNPDDGCEVNLNTTVSSCGACARMCVLNNATPACVGGRCVIAACNVGVADCNANPVDGCEVNTNGDTRNCGGCGRVCALPNVAAHTCVGGACGIGACVGGFADCDRVANNGCEVNLNTDARNCGSCGVVCPSGICREGACQSFGGAFERSDPTCAPCFNGNPAAGNACMCPGGFGTAVTLRTINDCRGRGSQHGALITFCGASAPGDYAGAFQIDDAVPGGLGCRAANPYTGGCGCPAGTTPIRFRTIADSARGIIGSSLHVCVRPGSPRPSFGGAYQIDDAVPGGVGCRTVNPVTGACSCPAGTSGFPLRVEVDSSRGFIGSHVIFCAR